MLRPRRLPLLALLLAVAVPAAARTLTVGPGGAFARLSAAVAAAQDGDLVRIDPGIYSDCAILRRSNVTIEGASEDRTVLIDRICDNKAILVITGNNATVRNLTLARARVPWGNAAGIRAAGRDLLVSHVRFVDDQNGILSAPQPDGTITVRDSEFIRDGACIGACAHGIYAGPLRLLRVEHTIFRGTRQGHHLKSRASRTEVIDCVFADGPDGTASYHIDLPNGGALLATGNLFEKGPRAENQHAIISIGEENTARPTPSIEIANNAAHDDGAYRTIFVVNDTKTAAVLRDNRLFGAITPLSGPGTSQ